MRTISPAEPLARTRIFPLQPVRRSRITIRPQVDLNRKYARAIPAAALALINLRGGGAVRLNKNPRPRIRWRALGICSTAPLNRSDIRSISPIQNNYPNKLRWEVSELQTIGVALADAVTPQNSRSPQTMAVSRRNKATNMNPTHTRYPQSPKSLATFYVKDTYEQHKYNNVLYLASICPS